MITVPEGATLTITEGDTLTITDGDPSNLQPGSNPITVEISDPNNASCGKKTKIIDVYKCDPSNFPTTFTYSINGGPSQTGTFEENT
jgi:hypothetical protein